ncbi:hypothetical protein PC114_g5565 [Phytophthora cactorum]|uniref:Uncharacterized protein n=1 Tax=Phytophthora cactorum TaxID=29920 RepID=A0A8T1E9B1_9STRA|nr:hypothetical protein PC114_g5565 [Phytophthora cactorum]KAG2949774.1 hypothetical protein PC117_g4971 [Phytophthora cactorum]
MYLTGRSRADGQHWTPITHDLLAPGHRAPAPQDVEMTPEGDLLAGLAGRRG